VQVLQEGVQEQLLVVRGADDRGDPPRRLAAGPPAPLAHDELKAVGVYLRTTTGCSRPTSLMDDDELVQGVLVEDSRGLARFGRDGVQLGVPRK